ncbi:hypothetical protein EJD97_003485 [Solanum chilense]|uniref:Uncharacterized protein n=1 Tax=Solanum chilense TaxID=4083 RepID=A0A6N2C106_SOLCI|nr:hypothetical protein EJD97_003485 [Solanum chilense]
MVKQVPPASAHDAFRPAMEALAAIELLRHADIDVKVSVTSCISEIMRITAPNQPCDDAHLRQIQLIQPSLSKFEVRLISSLSYN